jgi:leucyl aminopeptidase
MTKVELTDAAAPALEADVVAVPVFEDGLEVAGGAVAALDAALGGELLGAARAEGFRGKRDASFGLSPLGRLPARRVLLLGLGPAGDGAGAVEALRAAAGAAARAARQARAASLAVALPAGLPPEAAARAAVEGALLGAYRFGKYKTAADETPALARLTVAVPGGRPPAEVKEAVRLGEAVAAAVAWARDLVNEAPVHCTPARLARAAQEIAREGGLRCEVKGPRDIEALGMGMFLGVARGSSEEPRLVKLSWEPKGAKAAARARPLVLVGKAITFDSGGLSLKPTDSMVTMNGDMAGSAAVLAAMRVVPLLAPAFPVHALLGACENMPGGRAYKPSDVLTAYDGKTVEITNTDAEGRLVLGDVLAWAKDTLAPGAMVDVATLTGACVAALGTTPTGAFGPDGPCIEAVLAAARAAGEDVWRLPLVESVKKNLDSDVADMKNTGERWGGAIAAAHFLHAFAGDVPWAHLDIAGPAHSAKERGYVGKGGTGVAVRTLVELVRAWTPPAAEAGASGPRRSAGAGRGAGAARRGAAAGKATRARARR